MARLFLYDASAAFGDEPEVVEDVTQPFWQDYQVPVRLLRRTYLSCNASASFGDESEIFGTPDPFGQPSPMPVRLRRGSYLEPCGATDLDSGPVEGETDATFYATWQLPEQVRKRAFFMPVADADHATGAFAEPEGQSYFDCGAMPLLRSREWIRRVQGIETGHTLWVSIGARYGDLRMNMARFGNLETRPARHGSVRVAPSQ